MVQRSGGYGMESRAHVVIQRLGFQVHAPTTHRAVTSKRADGISTSGVSNKSLSSPLSGRARFAREKAQINSKAFPRFAPFSNQFRGKRSLLQIVAGHSTDYQRIFESIQRRGSWSAPARSAYPPQILLLLPLPLPRRRRRRHCTPRRIKPPPLWRRLR